MFLGLRQLSVDFGFPPIFCSLDILRPRSSVEIRQEHQGSWENPVVEGLKKLKCIFVYLFKLRVIYFEGLFVFFLQGLMKSDK